MQMLNLTYTNHYGEILEFGKDGLFINASDLHNYEWNYDVINKKIVNFDNELKNVIKEIEELQKKIK